MSYRVAILPCSCNGVETKAIEEANKWAEWVIPQNADDTLVEMVAHKCAWKLPLKVFTPSATDSRYLLLAAILVNEYFMSEEHDWTLYVAEISNPNDEEANER